MTYTQQRELRENDMKNDKRTLLIKEEEPRRTKLCRIGQARTLKQNKAIFELWQTK